MNKRKIKHKCPICREIVIDDLVKHKADVHDDPLSIQMLAELEVFEKKNAE